MRYAFSSDLGWNTDVSTKHSLQLRVGLEICDFLEGKDIAETLARNQGLIRKDIQRIVIEEILPKVFADAGAVPVEGILKTNSHSRTKGHARVIERQSPQTADVEIHDKISVALDITTDRPVTALEALCGSNIAVANAITDDIMMHLVHQYFGVTNHNISTKSSLENGRLVEYEAKHEGDSDNRN